MTFTADLNTCGTFSYSLTNNDLTPYDNSVFINFDNTIPTITLQTDSSTKVGIYNLILRGSLGSWSYSTTSITINILKSCQDSVITSSFIPNLSYIINDSTVTF